MQWQEEALTPVVDLDRSPVGQWKVDLVVKVDQAEVWQASRLLNRAARRSRELLFGWTAMVFGGLAALSWS